jgi:hypothetical protein
MLSQAVIARINVVEGVGTRFLSRSVAGAMHPIILKATGEARRRRIIPAIPDTNLSGLPLTIFSKCAD